MISLLQLSFPCLNHSVHQTVIYILQALISLASPSYCAWYFLANVLDLLTSLFFFHPIFYKPRCEKYAYMSKRWKFYPLSLWLILYHKWSQLKVPLLYLFSRCWCKQKDASIKLSSSQFHTRQNFLFLFNLLHLPISYRGMSIWSGKLPFGLCCDLVALHLRSQKNNKVPTWQAANWNFSRICGVIFWMLDYMAKER